MCGIAGLVCSSSDHHPDHHAPLVARMCELQRHRGPDEEGVTCLGRACLGSNRLSIIDLSQAGRMPMSDADGDWWIVYNGEIYNYRDLRPQLIERGYRFRSETDTEVVLHAFREWGVGALDRLVGMFAFAIYQQSSETLTLVRDRFGKKPLYYCWEDDHFLFASELKALLRVMRQRRVDHRRLAEWALYRNVDWGSSETLVENVRSLLPGHWMQLRRGQPSAPQPYYLVEAQVDPAIYADLAQRSAPEITKEIESLAVTAVRDRLVSDVPVGTLCSGGIDSSLITALAARDLPKLQVFHISVAGYPGLDESPYARRATDALGLDLLIHPMEAQDFRANLARATYHSDSPLTHPNSVAFLLISEFARRHGVEVLLSGEAADELFGGYVPRYRRQRQMLVLQRLLARLPAKVRKAIGLAGYAVEGVPITMFSEYEGLLPHALAFLDRFGREDLRERSLAAYGFVADPMERAVLGAMLADLRNFLAPLLRRLDRMSMAASVECRVPFLDQRLVHYVLNTPLSYRLKGASDKWVLKKIAENYLPHDLVHRKKVGFPLPVADYLAPLAREDVFRDGFCLTHLGMHPKGFMAAIANWRSNVHGFFNLLALEIWGRLLILEQTVDEVTEHLLEPATSGRRAHDHRPVPRPAGPAVAAISDGRGDF
jgi:asparagine synthase (glutamine-hydrolysing)